MPKGVVYVGRPTEWGNPYRPGDPDPMLIGATIDAKAAVRMFRWACEANELWVAHVRAELRGQDLACWCKLDAPCHADVLLEIANGAPATPPTLTASADPS